MKLDYAQEWPQFFTATIQDWKYLLAENEYKNIIMECLQFLVTENRVKIIGFVIMSNHVHFIWQAKGNNKIKEVQTSFIKFTSRKFMQQLQAENKIQEYELKMGDRKYHFWQRDSLSIELFTPAVLLQKLNYIHLNPVRAGLCKFAVDYYFSSAIYYEKGIDSFNLLEHYLG